MVLVRGRVNSNILWQKEVTESGEPNHGSVRIKISSINWGNTSFSCDYKQTEFAAELPFLELSYEIGNSDYSLVENLKAGDTVAVEVWQNSIYIKEKHFTQIKDIENGEQIKLYYLKCVAHSRHVKRIEYLNSLAIPSYQRKRIVSTPVLVEKLLTVKPNQVKNKETLIHLPYVIEEVKEEVLI